MSPELIEQSTELETPVPVEETPPATSIAEHARQFSPEAREKQADEALAADTHAEPTAEERAAHHSEQQRREKETGRFDEGKRRNNPVKRINELTGRAKAAEERAASLERELQQARSAHAPQAQPQRQAEAAPQIQRYVDPRDPEPKPQDGRFGGDYGKFLAEQARWAARDEYRQVAYHQHLQQQAQSEKQQKEARDAYWIDRRDKARSTYADFDELAFQAPTPWAKDSIPDALIEKHDNGLDLLYYLQSHPQERDSILQMPEHKQVVALSLILQRFESTGAVRPGTTGSGSPSNIRYLPPKPLNPVRTEAQQSRGTPPPTDGSLSIAEHSKRFGPQARRR